MGLLVGVFGVGAPNPKDSNLGVRVGPQPQKLQLGGQSGPSSKPDRYTAILSILNECFDFLLDHGVVTKSTAVI